MPNKIEVTYAGTFVEEGEKFGKATITCSCGWVRKVRDSFEDFEAHIRVEVEDHKCLGTTTKKGSL